MSKGKLHPDTDLRLKETGLTKRDFEKANERRRWLALLRILKIYLRISKAGPVSLRRLAIEARANWRTCKEAIKLTLDFVLEKVRQAFVCSVSRVANYIDNSISSTSSSEQNQNSGSARVALSLKAAIERCKARGSDPGVPRSPSAKVTDRQEQLRQEAIKYQQELAKQKANKPDEGVMMTPQERTAFLRRREAPGPWDYFQSRVLRRIGWKKKPLRAL